MKAQSTVPPSEVMVTHNEARALASWVTILPMEFFSRLNLRNLLGLRFKYQSMDSQLFSKEIPLLGRRSARR